MRRFARSARTPPRGESRMVGSMDTASRVEKTAAEPVSSSTYMLRAKRSV